MGQLSAGDAQDHGGHAQPDDGIEAKGAGGDRDGAGDHGERDVCVDAGMIAVRDQCGTVQSVPGACAYLGGEPVAGESDRAGEGEDEEMTGRGWVDQAQDRLDTRRRRRR